MGLSQTENKLKDKKSFWGQVFPFVHLYIFSNKELLGNNRLSLEFKKEGRKARGEGTKEGKKERREERQDTIDSDSLKFALCGWCMSGVCTKNSALPLIESIDESQVHTLGYVLIIRVISGKSFHFSKFQLPYL